MVRREGPFELCVLSALLVILLPTFLVGTTSEWPEDAVGGFMVGVAALAVAVFIYRPEWWTALAAVFAVMMALGPMISARSAALETPHERWRCQFRLKSVALALENYRSIHGSYPPACIRDKHGKPMHSWRVLVLPYLSGDRERCNDLYKRYDFNEPWDGPNNRKLLGECPLDYKCVDALPRRTPEDTTTSYVAVVGPHAAWTGPDAKIPKDDIAAKKAETTVMLIEVPAAAGIQWTEPRDLYVDALQGTNTRPVAPIVHQRTSNKQMFSYRDGISPPEASVAFACERTDSLLEENLTVERLRSLLAVGGCSEKDCQSAQTVWKGTSHLRLRWFNCSAGVVWLAAVGFLFVQAARNRKKKPKPRIYTSGDDLY
jgi:hypothetical protein